MSPLAIAKKAKEKGLEIVALTDHNSALNCPAFEHCCQDEGIVPIFGIEVCTSEETHILALFKTVAQALELGETIFNKMLDIRFDPRKWGDQVYVDHNEEILGTVDRYLINAADITISDLIKVVFGMGGLVIPAHIERPYFSICSQLGFIPPEPFSALEVVSSEYPVEAKNYPLISSSDAHFLEDVGKRYSRLPLKEKSFEGLLEYFSSWKREDNESR